MKKKLAQVKDYFKSKTAPLGEGATEEEKKKLAASNPVNVEATVMQIKDMKKRRKAIMDELE